MQKPKPFRMRITRNQLREIAIQSISVKQNLSDFWTYVTEARKSGLLDMDERDIKNWLSTQEDLIYGLGFKREDEVASLSDSVECHDVIPNRSGMMEIRGTVDDLEAARASVAPKVPDPAATAKSLALVVDVAKRYGWHATGLNKSGQPTIFHHYDLDLHVYAFKRPELNAVGSDGIKHPCLQYEAFMAETPYKGDAVASLLVTCVASPDMALHIEGFCPGFLARWDRYQAKLQGRIERCSRDGQSCDKYDQDCGLCTRRRSGSD